jgi:hypothetical protein
VDLRVRGLLVAGLLLVPRIEVAAAPLNENCAAVASAAESNERSDCPGTPDWMGLFVSGELGPILAANRPSGPDTDSSASLVEFSAGSPRENGGRSGVEPQAAFVDRAGSENHGGADFLTPLLQDSETAAEAGGGSGTEIFDTTRGLAIWGLAALAALCIGALGVTAGVRLSAHRHRDGRLRTASARP